MKNKLSIWGIAERVIIYVVIYVGTYHIYCNDYNYFFIHVNNHDWFTYFMTFCWSGNFFWLKDFTNWFFNRNK